MKGGHGGPLMAAHALREQTFSRLEAEGFRPAGSLPHPDVERLLRPLPEIAARLKVLAALYTWVIFAEPSPFDSLLGSVRRLFGLRDFNNPTGVVPAKEVRERIKRDSLT